MRHFKNWIVLLIAITLLFGAFSIAQAEEKFIGFEFGVDYIKPSEDRFNGSGSHFALIFPIDKGISAAFYHESDRFSGEDTDTVAEAKVNITLDIDINELRIHKEIVPIVDAFLGVGHASVTNAFSSNAPIADVGVRLTPLKTQGKVSDIELSLGLLYRFLKINVQQPFGANVTDPNVDDLGGFAAGLNVVILF